MLCFNCWQSRVGDQCWCLMYKTPAQIKREEEARMAVPEVSYSYELDAATKLVVICEEDGHQRNFTGPNRFAEQRTFIREKTAEHANLANGFKVKFRITSDCEARLQVPAPPTKHGRC